METNSIFWQWYITAFWDLIIFAWIFAIYAIKKEAPKAIRWLKSYTKENPDWWMPDWYLDLSYRIKRMKKHHA